MAKYIFDIFLGWFTYKTDQGHMKDPRTGGGNSKGEISNKLN